MLARPFYDGVMGKPTPEARRAAAQEQSAKAPALVE